MYKRQIVQFVVNKDGSIVDAKVVRSVHPYLDKEALRVINTMPVSYTHLDVYKRQRYHYGR